MPGSASVSYNDVPYEFISYEQCHLDRIETIAALLGVQPAPVHRCRVLELGCASGGHLIPMAEALPNSNFVGIDLSDRQIEIGRTAIARLQLDNIELLPMNILEVSPDFGTFDYIIAHGVFSWVPHQVQQQLMRICRSNLSPNGISLVSYNTFPGWHLRRMIREMLTQHAGNFSEPDEMMSQSRRLLSVMTTAFSRRTDPYSQFMRAELGRLDGLDDTYLAHEHLHDCNEPIYFSQFAERAAEHDLQYLGDAEPAITLSAGVDHDVAEELQRMATDALHLEQTRDFLQNQMFRRSLLCGKEIPHSQHSPVEQLPTFHVSSALKPVSTAPDVGSNASESFAAPDGRQVSASDPLVKAALCHLSEIWPAYETVDRLRIVARERLGTQSDQALARQIDLHLLGQSLLSLWADPTGPLLNVQHSAPRFAIELSDRPKTSGMARLQAEVGPQVTNGRHQMVGLDDFHRQLLTLMDGTRTISMMVDAISTARDDGAIELGDGEQPFQADPDEYVRQRVQDMAASALLIE